VLRVALGVLLFAGCVTAAVRAEAKLADARIVVDADVSIGQTNPELLGVGWNTGTIERIRPLRPPMVRIDAHLDRVSPGVGELRLETLLDDVARVHDVGGEPLVILFPMPAWLGETRARRCTPNAVFFPDGCSPTLVAPDAIDAWEQLIFDVVYRLATAPRPAYLFEVWNEPDLPVFWHDTKDAFLETAAATHRAVARVREQSKLPVRIGGPGASSPGGVASYVGAMASRGLPLHFVSWHWYANYPFLGPDGAEGNIDPKLYESLRGINPNTTPTIYGTQVRQIRDQVATLIAAGTELVLDEWNLSAGGLDRRHDSHEGAAFVAASLIEMERAGLDRAAIYRSNSDRDKPGDWGILGLAGERKPAWWVLRAFQIAAGERLATSGDDPAGGLWVRASRRRNTIDVFLATFRALGGSGRRATIEIEGGCQAQNARIGTIDAESNSFARSRRVVLDDSLLDLQLPDQSLIWVTLTCRTSEPCLPTLGGSTGCRNAVPRVP
jgi:hypothetical protein